MEKAKEYTSEEQQWLTENRLSRFQNRITPSWIRDMGENEIFVFGSNVNGYHGGGAARFAMNNFGAVWGNGEGLQGSSYAIPTMEGLDNMQDAVKRFYLFARAHENYMFYVTPTDCMARIRSSLFCLTNVGCTRQSSNKFDFVLICTTFGG